MLKRLSPDALDRELAAHNPVSDWDLDDAARKPAATALLRHIFEMADGGEPDGGPSDAAGAENAADETEEDEASGRVEDPTPSGRLWLRRGPGRKGRSVRQLAVAVALIAVVAGGASGIVLAVAPHAVPHQTTTAWLASRPLAADVHIQMAPETLQPAASWRLASEIVPAGWKVGTPGAGPGAITCPSTTVCYVSGDASAGASDRSTPGGLYVSTDGARTWSVLALPPGFTFTSELNCVSILVCAAGGMEDAVGVFAETRDGGHRWTVTTTGQAGGIVQLDCVSASRCMGLSLPPSQAAAALGGTPTARPFDEHFVVTADGGRSWRTSALAATVRFRSLQCTSRVRCVTIGYPTGTSGTTLQGSALWTDDAGAQWQHGSVPSGVGFTSMSGLSCSGLSKCVAVGTVAVGAGCATALQPQASSGTVVSTTPCTVTPRAWVSTMLTTSDGGATWQLDALPASVPQPHLDAVSCAGPATCWAGGTAAVRGPSAASSVLVGTSDGGVDWTPAAVLTASATDAHAADSYLAIGSLSCPSAAVCVALGAVGQGATFAPVYRLAAAP